MSTKARTIGHEEIAAKLTARIFHESTEESPLQNGDLLPSENELMAKYGVARGTVRHALRQLVDDGLAVAIQGKGTRVRNFPPRSMDRIGRLGRGSFWKDPSLKIDNIEIVTEKKAPDNIAESLRLSDYGKDDLTVFRRRRYWIGLWPVQIAESYYPQDVARGTLIEQENTGSGGAFSQLKQHGYEPLHFREEVKARRITPLEARELQLAKSSFVLEVVRISSTAQKRPVELSRMILDPTRIELVYEFDAPKYINS